VLAEPSKGQHLKDASAQVHRRTPQMPRARARPGPGPLLERPQRKHAQHVPSRTGTLTGGPARKAKGGVQGFRGRGGRGRAKERRPRIACASRRASAA
jgi:hypothetical protein